MKRILIIGYGIAGKSLGKSLKANHCHIVGYLDDIETGSEVLGKLHSVNDIVRDNKVTDIYFAIPSASAGVVRSFVNNLDNDEVHLSIIPRSFHTISKKTVSIHDLTDVDILSLVGRAPVKHDLFESKEFINGKTIVVTGAAGSIGSKLVKLLLEMKPKLIVCVDWWENGTFFLQQELGSDKLIYRIADIKSVENINRIFSEFNPEIVFHAAAYKHVPLMQGNPIEAFNNNVWGSLNLMRQAINHKVENFVYVSTDKAVNPVNVMGTSKRLGEMIMESMAAMQGATKFNAVRFGNVIQSNGSVMQIFKSQIDKGQSLTVTHEKVTRFFMTIEEAAQLIIQSAVLGKSGEIFVLDMGEPIKIIDLAESLRNLIDRSMKIDIIGLRPGEKMYEELSYDPSSVDKTRNEKVFIVKDELSFDRIGFIDEIDDLTSRSLRYDLTSPEMILKLKAFGFKIKD
ncbi:MAG: polysaccharide biosynthesis protein [Candidatus Saccharimonas sp.]